MSQTDSKNKTLGIVADSKTYFTEVVGDALVKRKMQTPPMVTEYLVQLLEVNMVTANSTVQGTFAEMLLRAAQAERAVRVELLRKLGDTSLYISGFFGDSLKRKIVDIDYYADIGGIAYGSLACEIDDRSQASVFTEFSNRFLDYVDVLTYISQGALVQSNRDLLRLYERYVKTGSELAKDQLMENGLLNPVDPKKVAQ